MDVKLLGKKQTKHRTLKCMVTLWPVQYYPQAIIPVKVKKARGKASVTDS